MVGLFENLDSFPCMLQADTFELDEYGDVWLVENVGVLEGVVLARRVRPRGYRPLNQAAADLEQAARAAEALVAREQPQDAALEHLQRVLERRVSAFLGTRQIDPKIVAASLESDLQRMLQDNAISNYEVRIPQGPPAVDVRASLRGSGKMYQMTFVLS